MFEPKSKQILKAKDIELKMLRAGVKGKKVSIKNSKLNGIFSYRAGNSWWQLFQKINLTWHARFSNWDSTIYRNTFYAHIMFIEKCLLSSAIKVLRILPLLASVWRIRVLWLGFMTLIILFQILCYASLSGLSLCVSLNFISCLYLI